MIVIVICCLTFPKVHAQADYDTTYFNGNTVINIHIKAPFLMLMSDENIQLPKAYLNQEWLHMNSKISINPKQLGIPTGASLDSTGFMGEMSRPIDTTIITADTTIHYFLQTMSPLAKAEKSLKPYTITRVFKKGNTYYRVHGQVLPFYCASDMRALDFENHQATTLKGGCIQIFFNQIFKMDNTFDYPIRLSYRLPNSQKSKKYYGQTKWLSRKDYRKLEIRLNNEDFLDAGFLDGDKETIALYVEIDGLLEEPQPFGVIRTYDITFPNGVGSAWEIEKMDEYGKFLLKNVPTELPTTIKIYRPNGELVKELVTKTSFFDISDLPEGYFFFITIQNGTTIRDMDLMLPSKK